MRKSDITITIGALSTVVPVGSYICQGYEAYQDSGIEGLVNFLQESGFSNNRRDYMTAYFMREASLIPEEDKVYLQIAMG